VRLSLEHTPVFIPIQLEDAGFLSSSSNTKPGGFLRGKSLFSPLNSRGYTAHHSNTSRTFLRDNALTETSVLKGERYKGFNVRGSFAALPFLPESMDVVLLPHVLEFASDPQAILAQSYIVLAPEGRLIILGFNPWSLWGLSRYGLHRKAFPWQSRFLSAFCVKKWLIQQEFIVEETHSLFFRPPVESKESLQRAMALEALGPLLWANNGGVYLIVARKRVTPFTPITESFGYAGSL
jgi:SAM-dependent methyltransferase